MKKNRLFLFGLIIFAFILSSCDIGLGQAIDLVGPDVTLISPTMRQQVPEEFEIAGTAYDNIGVKTLTVTLDNGAEWKHENGIWTYKASNSDQYTPCDEDTVEWKEVDRLINWKIKKATTSKLGKQMLIVSAVDESGNTTANSQKKITIIYDKESPEITITSPYIKYTARNEIEAAFPEKHTELQIVNNVVTGPFNIAGIAVDDNSINYVQVLVKSDKGSVQKDLKRTGTTELPSATEKDSLRNWSVEIKDNDISTLVNGTGKNYLEILTKTSDASGNADNDWVSHGYILFWKYADTPWITLTAGENKGIPTNVYLGSKVQGTAYDNEKVTELKYTIKKDGTSIVEGYEDKNVDLGTTASEEKSQAINFSLEYPNDVGIYEITLTAKDKNTNTAKATGWIEVLDMTFPSIEIDEITNPFGDKNGNITITTHAYDDTGVANIKYKICTTAADKTNYASKNSGSWDSPTATITDLGTPESASQNRKKYNKDIKINLFEDLGIGMDSGKKNLEQTTFFFLVEDIKGNKSISKFVLPADTTPPTVKIEKIDGKDANLSELPVFLNDFKITGTWGDDSFKAWKSTDSNKIPKLVVKVRGKELTTTQNTDGTWETTVPLDDVKESGSVVGAIDVEVSITDIGGSTTKVQKGYQIDTDVPTLDYVTCDKPNGVYGSNTEIIISLYMTKNFTFNETSATSVPVITLNNGKTAAYTGKNENVLTFKYTVGTSSTEDTDKLQVSSIDLKGYVIKDIDNSDNEFKQSDLNNAFSQNNINKNIRILTEVPAYVSSSGTWSESTEELTFKFSGLVTANSGTVTITQNDDQTTQLYVPAYLTKDEYNNMPALQEYYEEGTLGADSTFKSDLTTKYILKYNLNTNDGTIKTKYKSTGAHTRTIDIRAEGVTIKKEGGETTFTIQVGKLPCKGTKYTVTLPEGLVKNDAGTTNSAATFTIESTGTEPPVIRLKKPGQKIENQEATQQLTTTFKIDCRTPNAALKYSYSCSKYDKPITVKRGNTEWYGTPMIDEQEEIHVDFEYDGKIYTTQKKAGKEPEKVKDKILDKKKSDIPATFTSESTYSKSSSDYARNAEITLGKDNSNNEIPYSMGLQYNITATANTTESAFEVAYRTTLELKKMKDNFVWLQGTKNDAWDGQSVALFLRGGDQKEGANSTSGLPCSWNPAETDKIVMFTKKDNDFSTDFYYTTWNINVDTFYFQVMGGLTDTLTDTDVNGVSKGPYKSTFLQYGHIFRLPEYPLSKGEYMIFDAATTGFDIRNNPDKVITHRKKVTN